MFFIFLVAHKRVNLEDSKVPKRWRRSQDQNSVFKPHPSHMGWLAQQNQRSITMQNLPFASFLPLCPHGPIHHQIIPDHTRITDFTLPNNTSSGGTRFFRHLRLCWRVTLNDKFLRYVEPHVPRCGRRKLNVSRLDTCHSPPSQLQPSPHSNAPTFFEYPIKNVTSLLFHHSQNANLYYSFHSLTVPINFSPIPHFIETKKKKSFFCRNFIFNWRNGKSDLDRFVEEGRVGVPKPPGYFGFREIRFDPCPVTGARRARRLSITRRRNRSSRHRRSHLPQHHWGWLKFSFLIHFLRDRNQTICEIRLLNCFVIWFFCSMWWCSWRWFGAEPPLHRWTRLTRRRSSNSTSPTRSRSFWSPQSSQFNRLWQRLLSLASLTWRRRCPTPPAT